MASRQNRVRDQASHSRKQQTTRSHLVYTDGSVTKDQSLSSKVHIDRAALIMVSTYSWTMEVEADTHAFSWIASRGDSWTTRAIIPTDSVRLLQKVKSGNGMPRLECVHGQHPPLKTAVGALPWTCWSAGE